MLFPKELDTIEALDFAGAASEDGIPRLAAGASGALAA
jgi:hypothetical protein